MARDVGGKHHYRNHGHLPHDPERERNTPDQLGIAGTARPETMAPRSGHPALREPRMTLLDRYIVRQFLVTMLFALVAVLIIFIVIDVMEKLDNFVDRKAEWAIILQYYVFFIPEIIKLIIPVAMLLA